MMIPLQRFNRIFHVLPLAVLIIFTGCATPVSSLETVHAGMTQEEVIRLYGLLVNRMAGNYAMESRF